MRRLARLLLAAFAISAAPAAARPVRVRLPWIVEACPEATRWDAMAACLATHGATTIVHDGNDAKLVHVIDRQAAAPGDLGVYLFVRVDHAGASRWRLGGLTENSSGYEASSLSPITVGHHRGWRIDLELRQATTVQLDSVTDTPGILDRKLVVLCAGGDYHCTTVMTSCDVLVHGKAYWSFRGKLAIDHGVARIEGDQRNAGIVCDTPSEIALGWPDQ